MAYRRVSSATSSSARCSGVGSTARSIAAPLCVLAATRTSFSSRSCAIVRAASPLARPSSTPSSPVRNADSSVESSESKSNRTAGTRPRLASVKRRWSSSCPRTPASRSASVSPSSRTVVPCRVTRFSSPASSDNEAAANRCSRSRPATSATTSREIPSSSITASPMSTIRSLAAGRMSAPRACSRSVNSAKSRVLWALARSVDSLSNPSTVSGTSMTMNGASILAAYDHLPPFPPLSIERTSAPDATDLNRCADPGIPGPLPVPTERLELSLTAT